MEIPDLLGDDDSYDDEEIEDDSDPLEAPNRITFKFNDVVYGWVFNPLYNGYVYVTPEIARIGVGNIFHNLNAPIRFAGAVLQLKGDVALIELGGFLINSTWGIGGLIRIVDENQHEEDIGQALGYWGIPAGPYLVLPLLGPSSLRDGIGLVGDNLFYPGSYIKSLGTRVLIYGGDTLHNWKEEYSIYKEITKSIGVEPYVSMRNAFLKRRERKIKE